VKTCAFEVLPHGGEIGLHPASLIAAQPCTSSRFSPKRKGAGRELIQNAFVQIETKRHYLCRRG
jgi:hypothetical protein